MNHFLSWNCEFWLDDIGPLDDVTRILVFGLTFAYTQFYTSREKSFLCLSQRKCFKCEKEKIWIYDDDSNSLLMKHVLYPLLYHLAYTFKTSFVQIIQYIEMTCKISWTFVIFGFGRSYSMFMLFSSVFILVGLSTTVNAMHHNYHCLFMTFGPLCFSSEHSGKLSIDHYICENNLGDASIHSTGFGPKLAIVLLMYSLFSAGICKLQNSEWLTGESLYFYIYRSSAGQRKKYLPKKLKNHKFVFRIFSILSVALELMSICLLFVYKLEIDYFYKTLIKLFFVLLFIAFHSGIRLFMVPNFSLQCICYFVCIPFSSMYSTEEHSELCQSANGKFDRFVMFGNFMIILLLFTVLFRIESFPFTTFPMYSDVRKVSDCKPIPAERIYEMFELRKARNIVPEFNPIYHFYARRWLKFEVLVYAKNDDKKLLFKFDIKKPGGTNPLVPRRRNDALYQLYLNDELRFPMILGDGYFVGSDEVEQHKYLNCHYDDLEYVRKYLSGLMMLLQKRNTFSTYDVYPRYGNANDKGCFYQMRLDLKKRKIENAC